MPDPIFSAPRLARLYDAFDGPRDDLDHHLSIARELGARSVVDVGCGTGSFALLLAAHGFEVTAVDPAQASLEVARRKPGGERVAWLHGDATTLPPLQVDLAVMTGNVAQVFVTDGEWIATLVAIHAALRPGGHLVFETRRPEYRAWEEWAVQTDPVAHEIDGEGTVIMRREVIDAALPYVSFRQSYTFPDGTALHSDSTLRFRPRDEIEASLAVAGFTTVDVRDAPDRPGREHVFIARRQPATATAAG